MDLSKAENLEEGDLIFLEDPLVLLLLETADVLEVLLDDKDTVALEVEPGATFKEDDFLIALLCFEETVEGLEEAGDLVLEKCLEEAVSTMDEEED